MQNIKILLKEFFSKKENWLLLAIILVAVAIRLYFFSRTYTQALWWDEADYMQIAKHYAFGTPDVSAPWRARGMSLIFAVFYFFGATEFFQRLVVVAVSVLAVYLTYLLGKEFYNPKVGLIAASFMAVNWQHLFWSMRFSGEVFALVFFGFASLFFWRGYVLWKSKWYMIASGALIAYGIFLYESVGAIFVFLLVFLFVTDRFRFLKSKQFWWGVLGLMIVLAAVFAHYYALYGQIYPRVSHIIEGSLAPGTELSQKIEEQGFISVASTAFVFFTNLPDYLLWLIFVFVLVGVLSYADLVVGFDLLWKKKEPRFQKDFFVLWWGVSVLLFFGLYLAVVKTYYEPRYVFPAYPILFLIGARGVLAVADAAEKFRKYVGIVVILLVIGIVAYSHVTLADEIIDVKRVSYAQEKPAGEWLKANTEEGDVIFVCNQDVPFQYYTERQVVKADGYTVEELGNLLEEYQPVYYVLDFYHWDCEVEYIEQNQDRFVVAQVYYEGDQPVIVVFQVLYLANETG